MYLTGEFQAKKLTKSVSKDGRVFRDLWIKDAYDEDYSVSFDESLLPLLKPNGVYLGTFDFQQRQKYQGYGTDDKVILVGIQELKKDWTVEGSWDV